jgi:hypothetical protein
MSKPGARVVSHAEQQTQRTAAGAGQSASVNEELTAQSEAMLHIVGRLTALPTRTGRGGRRARCARSLCG